MTNPNPTKPSKERCPNCKIESIGGDIEMFGCPMCNPTMEDRFWSKVDKHGISVRDRFIEPLLVHIKELMPDSDREVDIEDTMIEFVNKLLKANNKKWVEGIKGIIGKDEEHDYAWENPKLPEIARNNLRTYQRQALKSLLERKGV